MTLVEAIQSRNWAEVITIISEASKDVEAFRLEYNGERTAREDQVGNRADITTEAGPVTVNKLPVQFQKKIVKNAASFLFGNLVRLSIVAAPGEESAEEENAGFQMLRKEWNDLRLDSKLLKACETVKSETNCAIILRAVVDGVISEEDKGKDVKLKANVITSANGKLMPGFNEFGDMICFGYQFKGKDESGEDVDITYIYLPETIAIIHGQGDEAKEISNLPHNFKRIPVVYLSQAEPDWWDVRELIDRFEMNLSKFADTNDYFASPFFKAVGKIDQVPEKDNVNKVYMMDIIETPQGQILQSDLDVVSWDRAPEALKMEFEIISELIYSLTDTADLSFNNVKGLGDISGVALKMMFLSPLMKSKFDQGVFKTAIERLINVLRAGLVYAKLDMNASFFEEQIDIEFQSIMPDNVTEAIAALSEATAGKNIMSQKTAVEMNPLVKNSKKELEAIKSENAEQLGETQEI